MDILGLTAAMVHFKLGTHQPRPQLLTAFPCLGDTRRYFVQKMIFKT